MVTHNALTDSAQRIEQQLVGSHLAVGSHGALCRIYLALESLPSTTEAVHQYVAEVAPATETAAGAAWAEWADGLSESATAQAELANWVAGLGCGRLLRLKVSGGGISLVSENPAGLIEDSTGIRV